MFPMAMLPLVGHAEARNRVAEAIRTGNLPQTILVVGPAGVGKQRFALWTAQRIVCQAADRGEPCGACGPCRKVLNLAHPDVHWFVPIPRPKAQDVDRQVEEAEETLAEVMEERRKAPLWSGPDGMSSHGVASARLLLRKVSLTPVEAPRKVFIVGDAERLIPQEANPEAANALLKVLEEPPADTVFLLTASEPRRLLPTIRSRAVVLRLGRLTGADVRDFLSRHAGQTGAELEQKVRTGRGAIGAALQEDGTGLKAREAARAVLDAVAASDGTALERVLRQNPWQARGEFSDMLDALGDLLADTARERAGAAPLRPVPPGLCGQAGLDGLTRAMERVQVAHEAAQGNVNPQLLLAALSAELEEALCS